MSWRRALLAVAAAGLGFAGFSVPASADVTTFTWTGAGATSNWSDGANWDVGVAPSGLGRIVVFPAGPAQKATTDDLDTAVVGSVQVGAPGYTLTIPDQKSLRLDGDLSGSDALTVTGPGPLLLAGAQPKSFTGTLTIGGTVRWEASNLLLAGSHLATLSGGLVDLNGFDQTLAQLDLAGATAQTLGGLLTVSGDISSTASSTINGRLQLAGAAHNLSVTPTINNPLTVNAHLTGSDPITKAGGGTLTLNDACSYTGPLTVNGGQVSAPNGYGGTTPASGFNQGTPCQPRDSTPPTVSITSAPASPTSSTAASIAFSGSDPTDDSSVLRYFCTVDGIGPQPTCPDPYLMSSLANGTHTFAVYALDAASNKSNTATATWRVDTTAPTVSVTAPPPARSINTGASVYFVGSDPDDPSGLVFTCVLDGGAATGCTSPWTGTLPVGTHELAITASDPIGNVGQPAKVSWIVDAPGVALDTTPPPTTNGSDSTVTFHGGTSYTCSLDGAAAAPCSSPFSTGKLPDGTHTLVVYGVDANGQSTSATTTWLVDTKGPAATVKSLPLATIATKVGVSWSATDGGSGVSTYDVRYRRAAWNGNFGSWVGPSTLQHLTAKSATLSLAAGYDYCVQARAKDKAGNVGAWSAARCVARALDDRALSRTRAWSRGKNSASYLGTLTTTKQRGVVLSLRKASADRLALVVTRCKGCGSLTVSIGKKRVGTVSLAATKTLRRRVVLLPKFALTSGTITLTTTRAKPVYVDGIVVTRS